jgi:hypothetical protein
VVGDDKFLLVDNLLIQIHTYNDKPIGLGVPAPRRDHRDLPPKPARAATPPAAA